MTGQDLVLVLGAYSAFVLGAFGLLIKFVLDTRRATTETNKAVNNRPNSEPTLRQLVEDITDDVRQLRHESFDRHRANTGRLDGLTHRMSIVEKDLKQHMRDVVDNQGEQ